MLQSYAPLQTLKQLVVEGWDVSDEIATAEVAAKIWQVISEDQLSGLELAHYNDGRGCILCEDPTENGRFRAQFWDDFGLLCHITLDSLAQVFEEVLEQGFVIPSPGLFDASYLKWSKAA